MEKEKRVFKISDNKSNMKFLNGWSMRNEKLYETLSFVEKKYLDEILIEEMENYIPCKRSSFDKLYNRVRGAESLRYEVVNIRKSIQSLIDKYGHSIIKRFN